MATCFKIILNRGFGPNIEDFPFHFVPLFWGLNERNSLNGVKCNSFYKYGLQPKTSTISIIIWIKFNKELKLLICLRY
jgi:hypothetical protein